MDLRFLRELIEKPGPFATVYLDASHDTDDSARALALRWAEARSGLADRGADHATLDALSAAVEDVRAEALDTLLLDAGVARDTTVWISDAPAQVAESAEVLRAAGAEPTASAPVDAALLRAAAGTGAAFVPVGGGRTGLVGHPLDDGVGALLRYPLPAGA